MARLVVGFLFIVLLCVFVPRLVLADEGPDGKISETERRLADIEREVANIPTPVQSHGSDGGVLFLFGAFCALWAQNTNRNPWLWFFMGLIFSVITVLVLLSKNSEDLRHRRQKAEIGFAEM